MGIISVQSFLDTILSSSALILIVLGLRWIGRKSVQRRFQYAIWAVVLLRLLLPISLMPSNISVLNFVGENSRSITYGGSTLNGEEQIGKMTENPSAVVNDKITHTEEKTRKGNILELLKNGTYRITEKLILGCWAMGFFLIGGWFIWLNGGLYLRLRHKRVFVRMEKNLPVYFMEGIHSPFLFGIFRPSVYINPEVWNDEKAKDHVLLHEVTHYRHGDHLWSVLRSFVLSVYWFDPFVWIAAICVKKDCELACDETVLNLIEEDERLSYGETLLKLVTNRKSTEGFFTASTAMSSGNEELKERVERIVSKQRNIIVVLILCIILVGGACAVTYTGALKQEAPKPKVTGVTTVADLTQTMKTSLDPKAKVLALFPDDYDKDGVPELYSVVNTNAGETDPLHGDEVWFVKKGEMKRVFKGGLSKDSVSIWDMGERKLFRFEEEYSGSGSVSHVWSVKSGNPYELKHAGEMLSYDGNGEFSTYPSAFDLMPDGTGHTWKRYYLYYDKESGTFREHGGILISEKDLLRVPKAKEILMALRSKKYGIHEIFYRENGVININYSTGTENLNLTLLLKDGKAILEDPKAIENPNFDQGGIYRSAANEEIATYPKKFPY